MKLTGMEWNEMECNGMEGYGEIEIELTGIERFVMNGTGIVMKLHESNGMTRNGQSKTQ